MADSIADEQPGSPIILKLTLSENVIRRWLSLKKLGDHDDSSTFFEHLLNMETLRLNNCLEIGSDPPANQNPGAADKVDNFGQTPQLSVKILSDLASLVYVDTTTITINLNEVEVGSIDRVKSEVMDESSVANQSQTVDISDVPLSQLKKAVKRRTRKKKKLLQAFKAQCKFDVPAYEEVTGCPLCPEVFVGEITSDFHLGQEHSALQHLDFGGVCCCPLCKEQINATDLNESLELSFIAHMQTHISMFFRCVGCLRPFGSKSTLMKHKCKADQPSSVGYRCYTVDYRTVYQCNSCEKQSTKFTEIVNHTRRHTGERPTMCDLCGKCFFDGPTMRSHRRSHRGKRYECMDCGNKYNQKTALNIHVRSVHKMQRDYECPQCPKKFFDRHKLAAHVMIHTGEKPFSCEICGRAFTQKINRDQHFRLHTKEKVYSCDFCKASFSQRSSYNAHIRKHTGVKPGDRRRAMSRVSKEAIDLDMGETTTAIIEVECDENEQPIFEDDDGTTTIVVLHPQQFLHHTD